MRLSAQHADVIRAETQRVFGPDARVILFGSRTDDRVRGGDIDLLVQAAHEVAQPTLKTARLWAALQLRLGEQKIDIVLEAPNLARQAIHRVALEEGVPL
jgi:predicted nucleotidyltransferase